jgi:hypothetical protein
LFREALREKSAGVMGGKRSTKYLELDNGLFTSSARAGYFDDVNFFDVLQVIRVLSRADLRI